MARQTAEAAMDANNLPPLAWARRLLLRSRRLLARSGAGSHPIGSHGVGLTFAELRDYHPGDDARGLDAKATARRARPTIKLYEAERQQTVWLVVDTAATLATGWAALTGASGPTKAWAALELAGLLAAAAAFRQDRVAVIPWDTSAASSAVTTLPPAVVGLRGAIRQLAELRTPKSPRTTPAVVNHFTQTRGPRGLVFLISDLLSLDSLAAFRGLGRRHELRWLHLIDPLDRALPNAGLVRFADPATGANQLIDTASATVRARYAAAQQQRLTRQAEECRQAGIAYVPIAIEAPPGRWLAALLQTDRRR